MTQRVASLFDGPPPPTDKGPRCSVSLLPPDVREALIGARGRGWPISKLEEGLALNGYEVGANALSRHFRGKCKC